MVVTVVYDDRVAIFYQVMFADNFSLAENFGFSMCGFCSATCSSWQLVAILNLSLVFDRHVRC